MYKILVTGASGFVGKSLLDRDQNQFHFYSITERLENLSESDIFDSPVVIHLAGLAHNRNSVDNDFYEVNTKLTAKLLKICAKRGLKRFIYLSSIGVNGFRTENSIFNEASIPEPYNAYTNSKYKAEEIIKEMSCKLGIEYVIIRPPLIYGHNAPGNLGQLCSVLKKNIPLPLGNIFNKRNFIALPNLIDFIINCINHPNAANQTFLISDEESYSTSEFIRILKIYLSSRSVLLPVPNIFLEKMLQLISKGYLYNSLCYDLLIDSSKARSLLNWKQRTTMKKFYLNI